MTSTLFPQLPPRSRAQFRIGLIVVAAAVAAFAILRLQVPVIAVSVFGLPVLLTVYLREIGVGRAAAGRFLLAAAVALGLGVVWALVAGPAVADAYSAALGGQMEVGQLLLCGVAIPMTLSIVLIAPAALVWAIDRSSKEALDGFTVGAVGATVANAAATATLLAPQLKLGLTADSQSVADLLAQALVEGVAWPLGALAVGGVFGIALWFRPADSASRWYRRSLVVPGAVIGAAAFCVAMGIVDVASIPVSVYIILQLLIAVAAVVAVRVVIADALLHEANEDFGDARWQCPECDHVVAKAPFCSSCGAAIHATSSDARAGREALADWAPAAPQPVRTYRRVLGPVIAGVGLSVVAAVGVAVLIKPAPPAYVCPPDCGQPPIGNPVETNPRFSGDNGAFSVAYPGEGTAYEVTFDPPGMNGVELRYTGGDTGILRLFGEKARGRSPEEIVREILHSKYPRAVVAYEIPNASVGYEPGYGIVADVYPRDTSSTYTRRRVIIMAAVRHDYALIASAAGPYHEFSPDYGTGHPSGANVEIAMDMGKYVNSFRWFGDRYGGSS